MRLKFECWENDKWYVVLPDWEGDQEDLEMVAGSDSMLDALTVDCMYVDLDVNTEEPQNGEYFILEQLSHDELGATYKVIDCDKFSGNVWFCNVVHTLFDEHPEKFYISIL